MAEPVKAPGEPPETSQDSLDRTTQPPPGNPSGADTHTRTGSSSLQAAYALLPLDAGWEERAVGGTQQKYYINKLTGGSTWKRPVKQALDRGVWLPAADPTSGRSYWYHSVTRQRSWKPPVEDGSLVVGATTEQPAAGSATPPPGEPMSAPLPLQAHDPAPRPLPAELRADIHRFSMTAFAQAHFQCHRRGFFSRPVPVPELLVHAKRVLQRGIANPDLRDELYCQLYKQTNSNPSSEGTLKGWQLMALCSATFPPTRDFEMSLLAFLDAKAHPAGPLGPLDTSVSIFAQYCITKLHHTLTASHPIAMPSTAQLSHIKPIGESSPGAHLAAAIAGGAPGFPLPVVLPFLANSILARTGHRTEGVFRHCASTDDLALMKGHLDAGHMDFPPDRVDAATPHLPAVLLKTWLLAERVLRKHKVEGELSDPVVPASSYLRCVSTEDPAASCGLLAEFPSPNRMLLKYLVRFLRLISLEPYVTTNKMTTNNVALMFAPNIIRNPSQDPFEILKRSQMEIRFMTNLLTHLVITPEEDELFRCIDSATQRAIQMSPEFVVPLVPAQSGK
ncbi:putative Rho GTPase activation protein [Paratrimastix pyriformis]|uniref:Rho GTPase activation protein n=1 Tax=Paratrimastix pyriformis TaxID=342808 RepID=A0ABQ8UBS4_9EUKA|nr:putative Rho GTPase activation protein [Paratrimastix pyriformis]